MKWTRCIKGFFFIFFSFSWKATSTFPELKSVILEMRWMRCIKRISFQFVHYGLKAISILAKLKSTFLEKKWMRGSTKYPKDFFLSGYREFLLFFKQFVQKRLMHSYSTVCFYFCQLNINNI